MSYHIGVYLAANAVPDSCLVMDGPNCVIPKLDFVCGNHDLYSTLLSHEGEHRVVCTMSKPQAQTGNPEKKLAFVLEKASRSGRFGVVMVTGLPFQKLAGVDYEGVVSGVKGGAPAAAVPARSLEADWLEGYASALEALARALPARGLKKRRRSVALVGYLMDRNERDHAANIAELDGLLGLCGLKLACVFPSGGAFAGLGRALEAETVVSLPYGRKAAAVIAARSGARLVETGLPMGFKGTAAWLAAVRRAAGLDGALPRGVVELERAAARAVSPAVDILTHRNILYAGDPFLFSAFASFARELRMRVTAGILDSSVRPVGRDGLVEKLLFSPDAGEAAGLIKGMDGYSRPDLAVGNSFAATEGLARGLPFVELGFPSYGHHCLSDEPFLGFAGARTLACRLINCLRSGVRV